MEKTYKVFVYGTLLVDECNHHVAEPHILKVQPGSIKGSLYNVGPYPALILDGETEIEGEWFTVTKEGLKEMDILEDYEENGSNNLYERVWVKDISEQHQGYVYVFSKESVGGLELIQKGAWRKR